MGDASITAKTVESHSLFFNTTYITITRKLLPRYGTINAPKNFDGLYQEVCPHNNFEIFNEYFQTTVLEMLRVILFISILNI